ncbi:hypothetical protein BC829DRAFT_40643 [Chytridium lagenaria]|nr:hypothetical protein BC829DRAFT_40643 [Chytridium lagenaria]
MGESSGKEGLGRRLFLIQYTEPPANDVDPFACVECGDFPSLKKGEIGFVVVEGIDQASRRTFWRHWRCVDTLTLSQITNLHTLDGFLDLTPSDQARILRAVLRGRVDEGLVAENEGEMEWERTEQVLVPFSVGAGVGGGSRVNMPYPSSYGCGRVELKRKREEIEEELSQVEEGKMLTNGRDVSAEADARGLSGEVEISTAKPKTAMELDPSLADGWAQPTDDKIILNNESNVKPKKLKSVHMKPPPQRCSPRFARSPIPTALQKLPTTPPPPPTPVPTTRPPFPPSYTK